MDFTKQQREAASIRADISKANKIVLDARARYIKAKLKVRNKKQLEEMEVLFADLADYNSKEEIQDFYGWGGISRTELERLEALWDAREHHISESGNYRDRVVDMLDKALSRIGDDYLEFLDEADTTARENERNQRNRW